MMALVVWVALIVMLGCLYRLVCAADANRDWIDTRRRRSQRKGGERHGHEVEVQEGRQEGDSQEVVEEGVAR
jgi:hypothetical protein